MSVLLGRSSTKIVRGARERWGRRKRLSITPGTTLGSYLIVEQIGRGGLATVYKAYEEPLTRHVAIKVLPEFFAEDTDYPVRVQIQAVAVVKLCHTDIVT